MLGCEPVQRAYKHGRNEPVVERGSGGASHECSAKLPSFDAADRAIQGLVAGGAAQVRDRNDSDGFETATQRSVLQRMLPLAVDARLPATLH